ncbi:piggyBac transposable element-derived protein 3-like [Spodoptera litura]|uniref:PiggyBac transposable element-derived protein 3-like n=1 Tax=Spodoptera litura TaxID=69820 RepID=A0A9J7IKI7_SPOLT|nr:piggyBac transposable element-derived protein 3-like [Spodoptera litura]
MAIIPPPPSVVTDEEEGPDENLGTTLLPRDIPGSIEVFIHNNKSDDDDSSDDEPLANKQLRRDQEEGIPSWHKCEPTDSKTSKETSELDRKREVVKEELKDLYPTQIFEKIFDEEVIELIVSNTNLYARQNNRHSFQLDANELLMTIDSTEQMSYCWLDGRITAFVPW